jgi:hypothetical protein
MKVGVGLVRHVVVDGDVDALNIDTTSKDVGGDTDTSLELLELFVALDTIFKSVGFHQTGGVNIPLLLTNARVHCSAGKVAFAKKLVELRASQSRTHKDDDLVKFEVVEEVVKLAVLLALIKLDVKLLKTVQRQLLLVIDVNLERVLHELLTDTSDLLGQSSRKHHDLLMGRGRTEDGLHIVAHVRLIQHLVTLIEDEVLQVGKAKVSVTDERVDTSRCADNDVRVGVFVSKKLDVLLHRCSSVENADLDVGQELREAVVLVPDLVGQFTGMAHYENRRNTGLWLLVHLLKGSEDEDGCLSETGLGLTEDIVSENRLRDGNLLDCRAQCMSERVS